MTLLAAAIFNQQNVVAEYAATQNYFSIIRDSAEDIPNEDGEGCLEIEDDDFMLRWLVKDGIIYVSLSDERLEHRVSYAFLQDIKGRFQEECELENAQQAIFFGMNTTFHRTIRKRMEYFNSDEFNVEVDDIKQANAELEDVEAMQAQRQNGLLETSERLEGVRERLQETFQLPHQIRWMGQGIETRMCIKHYWTILSGTALVAWSLCWLLRLRYLALLETVSKQNLSDEVGQDGARFLFSPLLLWFREN